MTAITNLPAAIAELREIVGRMTPGLQPDTYGPPGRYTMDAAGCIVMRTESAADQYAILALQRTALPIIDALVAERDAAAAEVARLREALMRLGKVGGSVVATFKPREVKLPDGEIGVAQGYGTVGKEIGQELMAALNEARAALGDQP